jgi:hypothetical protein
MFPSLFLSIPHHSRHEKTSDTVQEFSGRSPICIVLALPERTGEELGISGSLARRSFSAGGCPVKAKRLNLFTFLPIHPFTAPVFYALFLGNVLQEFYLDNFLHIHYFE